MVYFIFLFEVQLFCSQEGIFICEERYGIDLVKEFNKIFCKTCATHMNVDEKLSRNDDLAKFDENAYKSVVGSLMYCIKKRPNVMLSVSIVSRFVSSPSTYHLKAVKRFMREVGGTKKYGLFYHRIFSFQVTDYMDSDWAGNKDK